MLATVFFLVLGGCGEPSAEATATADSAVKDPCAEIVWQTVCNCEVSLDLRGITTSGEYEGEFAASFTMVEEDRDVAHAAICAKDFDGLKAGGAGAGEDSNGILKLPLDRMVSGSAWVLLYATAGKASDDPRYLYLDVDPEAKTDSIIVN